MRPKAGIAGLKTEERQFDPGRGRRRPLVASLRDACGAFDDSEPAVSAFGLNRRLIFGILPRGVLWMPVNHSLLKAHPEHLVEPRTPTGTWPIGQL